MDPITEIVRKCPGCGETKSIDQFRYRKSNKTHDDHYCWCRGCEAEADLGGESAAQLLLRGSRALSKIYQWPHRVMEKQTYLFNVVSFCPYTHRKLNYEVQTLVDIAVLFETGLYYRPTKEVRKKMDRGALVLPIDSNKGWAAGNMQTVSLVAGLVLLLMPGPVLGTFCNYVLQKQGGRRPGGLFEVVE